MHHVSPTCSVTAVAYAQLPLLPSRAGRSAPAQPLLAVACSDGSVQFVSHDILTVTHQAQQATVGKSASSHDAANAGSGRQSTHARSPTATTAAAAAATGFDTCGSIPASTAIQLVGSVVTADLLGVTCCQLSWRIPHHSDGKG